MGVADKVQSRRVFGALRASRLRSRSGPVRISFVDGDEFVRPAVAYAINRKVGGAVVRNLIRRRLRSIIVESSPKMRAGAYLISVSPEAKALAYEELKANVSAAIAAIANVAERKTP